MSARNRKTIIADAIGSDFADLEPYQPGRHRPPVFTAGDYYTAVKNGENPPPGYDWTMINLWRAEDIRLGWRVYRSV